MPAQRLSMRKIKEVLRLCWAHGLSKRKTARSCGISRPAVDEYLRRAEAAGLSWPLPAELDDGTLERLLFPAAPTLPAPVRGLPDWSTINRELKRKGVTLFLLWQEYRAHHPQGYQYSWFCEHYRAWQGRLDVVMRQDHRAGEKLFVDYAGQTVPVVDRSTGELREAQIFVAVLGASNYTYAEATGTQGLPDWIGSHQRTFAFLGGVPELVVPDYVPRNIIREHFGADPTEVLERPHQALIGMLGVLTGRGEEVKTPRVTQRVHCKVNPASLPGNHRLNLTPVMLQLLARCRLKAHRRTRPAQGALGTHIVLQDADAACVAFRLQFTQHHHRVPYPIGQQTIHRRLERVKLALTRPRALPRWCALSRQRPAHGLRVYTQFRSDVANVNAFLSSLLYHQPVLPLEHRISFSDFVHHWRIGPPLRLGGQISSTIRGLLASTLTTRA